MRKTQYHIMRLITGTFIVIFLTMGAGQINAQNNSTANNDTLTGNVLIHPPIETEGSLTTHEHTYKSKLRLGDQLGRDFGVSLMQETGFVKRFKNSGKTNEDWYAWRNDVLAPFEATVTRIEHPDTTNNPGVMNREAQPGLIFFKREDSVKVVYAHVREINVEEGEQVKPGEVVAKVGNNGNSRNPHVHIGAWKNKIPLQIQVDLYADRRYGNNWDQEEKSMAE